MSDQQVTIGIPAHNEAANIGLLLSDLHRQKMSAFSLKQIIVYADGCTDDTARIAAQSYRGKVRVRVGSRRGGIAAGLNYIFRTADTPVLIILNADIRITDARFIENLAQVVASGHDLVSCPALPVPAKGTLEKILWFGHWYKHWVFSRYRAGQNVYTCYGPARAFSRKFYRSFRLPVRVGEDMYSYLYCRFKELKYLHTPRTRVYFRLPSNLINYFYQGHRYLNTFTVMEKYFPGDFIRAHTGITPELFLFFFLGGLVGILRFPFQALLYPGLVIIRRFSRPVNSATADANLWSMAVSSKKVHL